MARPAHVDSSGRLQELRSKSQEFTFRGPAQVSVICKQMLSVIDRIETLRREEP